jgi:hypothetical protein
MSTSINETVLWDDAHRYSPAPRHRRRIILKWIRSLSFSTCLDAGCAQPFLLTQLHRAGKCITGCDISPEAIKQNRKQWPDIEFKVLDITKEKFPKKRQFELVICSEVLEHIKDWPKAVAQLSHMCGKYLLLTVPSGRRYPIDEIVGHYRHFQGPELVTELRKNGFSIVREAYWGFPVHSFYKRTINAITPKKIYATFAVSNYGLIQKVISQMLYFLFFINDLFNRGHQYFVLAEKKD